MSDDKIATLFAGFTKEMLFGTADKPAGYASEKIALLQHQQKMQRLLDEFKPGQRRPK